MKMFDVYPLNDVEIVRAEGSYVYDKSENRYLDFYGGHAVISIGHTNPRYVKAVTDQIAKIGFYSNSVVIGIQQELVRRFGKLTGKGDYQLFLVNSGAEANENAMKLASFHNGRRKVVAFEGSFHGRTSLAVAATDNPSIVAPVNETDNVIFLPLNDEMALRELFATEGTDISSVIIEGIQGVGGIREAQPEFLRLIRSLCDEHGAVYIADAVQCGCGRTGQYYSHDIAGADADIYTMAKGIGNGFPVGALAISPRIAPKYGMLGTTFGGNHLACAAMIAVAEEITEKELIANAREVGEYLRDSLERMHGIAEVRGRGLMIGIELPFDSTELRRRLLQEEKVFVGSSGKNIVRLLPALNITHAHADLFLEAFEKLLTEHC